MSKKRIFREIQDIMKDNSMEKNGYTIEQVDNKADHLLGKIRGPPNSPYEMGIYKVDIVVPANYPFIPPKCKFITKIWHPNVSSVTGAICLDVLKDQWAAAMTIGSVMVSIQTFIANAEPDDPQDAVVAHQYITNRDLFVKTAKYWTQMYAVDEPPNPKESSPQFTEFNDLVAKLMKTKAVNKDQALSALSCNDWDLSKSINAI